MTKKEISFNGKTAIIGGGAWGTAIANSIALNGHNVLLQARESEVVESVNNKHINSLFLPDIRLSENILATESLYFADSIEFVFLVTPAQFLRATLKDIVKVNSQENLRNKTFIICSKGIENHSLKLMSEVLREEINNPDIAILSGPTFAIELASGNKTIASLACENAEITKKILDISSSDFFKLITNDDIIGSQICGAVKNVIAIACGIVEAIGSSDNLRAGTISQGIKEISKINELYGGEQATLLEPCGIGDLILTCSSVKSRNYSYGISLVKNNIEIMDNIPGRKVVEGVETAKAVHKLIADNGLKLPICEFIYRASNGEDNPNRIFEII